MDAFSGTVINDVLNGALISAFTVMYITDAVIVNPEYFRKPVSAELTTRAFSSIHI